MDVRPGEDALQFIEGVEQSHVEEVLNGYRSPKGS
jgi:hypothetical protein